jgi:hypothetical protein
MECKHQDEICIRTPFIQFHFRFPIAVITDRISDCGLHSSLRSAGGGRAVNPPLCYESRVKFCQTTVNKYLSLQYLLAVNQTGLQALAISVSERHKLLEVCSSQ